MNYIESYISNSFITGDNAFTNLLIAIPIVITLFLLITNKLKLELLINAVIFLTLIFFGILIFSAIIPYHFYYILCVLIIILLWVIFFYKDQPIILPTKYSKEFSEKIKRKIITLQKAKAAKNILINGHWGSGKTYFVKNILPDSTGAIYVSCIDYPNVGELVNDLIYKSNHFISRVLIRFSFGKLLSIISKTELRQYIGHRHVIVFDEFERLFDYNKIDPMHIISLIQYLNNQKNCICILVANEDHLNNASQFNNVREKLISYFYHYKIPFNEVIAIIRNSDSFTQSIDLRQSQFSKILKILNEWYQIDNNIRMIEHLYMKINELYQATNQMFQEASFYKEHFNNTNKVDELFSGLFSYIDTVVIQLYYLYLKNPYFLTILEKFAGIYHDDTFIKLDKNNDIDQSNDNTRINPQPAYFIKKSLQQLARTYTDLEVYQNYYNQSVPCFKEVQDNEIFARVDQELIIKYLANLDFVDGFLEPNEISQKGTRQRIQFFIREFKKTICESDDPELLINYFKRLNILEERFLLLIDDLNQSWDYSIVTDYIAYCQYIKQKRDELISKSLPVSFNKVAYSNALIIQMILESGKVTIKQIVSEINNFNKPNELPSVLYERTCLEIINENKTSELIELIKAIADKLNKQKYQQMILIEFIHSSYFEIQRVAMLYKYSSNEADKNEFITLIEQMVNKLKESQQTPIKILQFMAKLYQDIKSNLHESEIIKKCNEKLIDLLTIENKPKDFMIHLFSSLSSFNSNDGFSENFPEDSLAYLIDKIKAVFSTPELLDVAIIDIKNIKGQIAKDVMVKLQEDLDKQNNQETE